MALQIRKIVFFGKLAEIVGDTMKMLGSKNTNTQTEKTVSSASSQYAKATGRSSVRSIDELDDDIPF